MAWVRRPRLLQLLAPGEEAEASPPPPAPPRREHRASSSFPSAALRASRSRRPRPPAPQSYGWERGPPPGPWRRPAPPPGSSTTTTRSARDPPRQRGPRTLASPCPRASPQRWQELLLRLRARRRSSHAQPCRPRLEKAPPRPETRLAPAPQQQAHLHPLAYCPQNTRPCSRRFPPVPSEAHPYSLLSNSAQCFPAESSMPVSSRTESHIARTSREQSSECEPEHSACSPRPILMSASDQPEAEGPHSDPVPRMIFTED
mmetsp:Transcript_17438/g.33640  ORF Transcript_17438/g.33640 Transcript_17438/m.33640 type:complete len:259 (-) Transcript_17438:10-786(-)